MPSGNTLQNSKIYFIPITKNHFKRFPLLQFKFLPQSQQFLNLSILPQTELTNDKTRLRHYRLNIKTLTIAPQFILSFFISKRHPKKSIA